MSQRALRFGLGALAAVLLFAPTALAQDEEDPEPEVSTPAPEARPIEAVWDRVLAVSATVGLDTPFGIGGAAIEVTPFRYLSIYAGGGVGRDGVRFAGGLRPQFPVGHGAMGLMLGVTGGPLDWDSRGAPAMDDDPFVGASPATRIHRWWEMALFLHGALSGEYRWDEGIFGRLEFGVEALVTPLEPSVCTDPDGQSCLGAQLGTPVRAWIGLTVGYALDL